MQALITLAFTLCVGIPLVLATDNPVCTAPAYVCVRSSGSSCASNVNTSYDCDYNLGCVANTCTTLASVGSPCTYASDCANELACLPDYTGTSVCSTQFAGPGFACSADGDCIYNTMDPNSGKRTSNSTCVSGMCNGLALGATCAYTGQCNYPNFCNLTASSPTCTAPVAQGQVCIRGVDRCAGAGAACFLQNATGLPAKCGTTYNGAAGIYCQDRSYCGDNQFCGNNVCVTKGTSTGTACTLDSDCTAPYETCTCSNGKAVCLLPAVYPTGFGKAYYDYASCFAANPKCNLHIDCAECATPVCHIYKDVLGLTTAAISGDNNCGLSSTEISLLTTCFSGGSGSTTTGARSTTSGTGSTTSPKTTASSPAASLRPSAAVFLALVSVSAAMAML